MLPSNRVPDSHRTPLDTPPHPHAILNPRTHVRDRVETGQKVQAVQVGCRKDLAKVHPVPKLNRFHVSFGGCRWCRRCRQNEKLFPLLAPAPQQGEPR